jgi:hypothetical protein
MRRLELRGGVIVAAGDAALDDAPGQRIRGQKLREFERTGYDRLRILTTELKRIARDGGYVAVHFGPGRRVPERLLAGVLRVV